jgi:hypothetical protein
MRRVEAGTRTKVAGSFIARLFLVCTEGLLWDSLLVDLKTVLKVFKIADFRLVLVSMLLAHSIHLECEHSRVVDLLHTGSLVNTVVFFILYLIVFVVLGLALLIGLGTVAVADQAVLFILL